MSTWKRWFCVISHLLIFFPPRPGFEGEAGGEVLSPLSELSDDPAAGTMLDDEATDPAIAALRSKRESDKVPAPPPPLPVKHAKR
jgi:hypothetical protein